MSAGVMWLIAALALGIGELIVPGVFLIFLAIAAVVTGVAVLALPALTPVAQIAAFAVWSAIAVLIGRRWYRDYPVPTTDPLLNDRAARLIGQVVTVAEPIVEGRGRVRVGDGEWPARGPALAIGDKARIVGVEDVTVLVEALTPLPPGEAPAA